MPAVEPARVLYVIFGPPGAGKSTMSKMLSQEFGIFHMPVGTLVKTYCLSEEVVRECKEINEKYLKGIPQDDDLVVSLVKEKIATLTAEKGVIADAFPLSIGQAKDFEEIAKEYGFQPPQAFYVHADEELVLKRISTRKICSQCGTVYNEHDPAYQTDVCTKCGGTLIRRPDDKPEVVRKRYQEYQVRLAPVMDFYRQMGRMHEVDGSGSPEEAYARFRQAVLDTHTL